MGLSNSSLLPLKPTIQLSPFLFLTSLLTLILTLTLTRAQKMLAIPTGPTIAECVPRLLPIAPCAPFVQGRVPGPSLHCCESLKEMYIKEKDCLCLFFNGTDLASLPINSTRVLQLPGLCSPQIDPSTCSASSSSAKGGSTGSSGSQALFESPSSSTTAASAAAPPVDSAPTPSIVGFGMGKNSAYKLKGSQMGVAAVITLMLAKLL